MMRSSCVIDTMVLRKANAPLRDAPREGRAFAKRLALLQRIRNDELRVLISAKLIAEYRQQVLAPRNDFVTSFFAILDDTTRCKRNWPPWPGRRKAQQDQCRFPAEDTHVLRTAFLDDEQSTIFTEEKRMLPTDACIHRNFGVHVRDPTK